MSGGSATLSYVDKRPKVVVVAPGPQGIQGPQGAKGDTGNTGPVGPMPGNGTITAFVALTQAQYDALTPKVATTVYVVTP